MELELGLKITKTRDDITSISQYQLAKDRTGPVFESRETNTMFILIAHLKGYKRNNIDIKISEDGSKISISGEKPIQEMMMMGWVMLKKDVEISQFNKTFKIPEGVVLDRIKAKFDEEESILKIVMPKSLKGICGARIEEIKEDESDGGRSELEKSEADHIFNSTGETSERGFREPEVREMEDSESVMEKEQVLSEKIEHEAMKESDSEQNVGASIPQNIVNASHDEESVREKSKKSECEAIKTLEPEQNVGNHIPQSIGDDDRDDVEKMLDKANGFSQDKHGKWLEKEFEELKSETEGIHKESVEEVNSRERFEETRTSELNKTENFEGTIKKDMKRPKNETVEGDDECEAENSSKEVFEAITTVREEFPKQLPIALQGGVEVSKREEPKVVAKEALAEEQRAEKANRSIEENTLNETSRKEDEESDNKRKVKKVAEAMALGENEKPGYGVVKLKEEGSIRMNFEANKVVEEDISKDRNEQVRVPKMNSRDQPSVKENTDKGGLHGSKRQELLEGGKTKHFEEEGAKIEQSVKKVNGEKNGKIEAEANEGLRRDLTRDTFQQEIDDPDIQTKESEQSLQESTGKGGFEASMAEIKDAAEVKEELVKQKSEAKVGEAEDAEDGAKLEQPMKQAKGEKHEKIQDETTMKGTKEPEIQNKEKDQQCVLEMNKGMLELSMATIEEAKEAREEFIKQQSGEKMEEPKDVNNKGATIQQIVEKETGEKHEKTQVEASGDLRENITKESKIQSEEKDQQSLHDAMSEERFELSTVAREFPLQKNGREGPNVESTETTQESDSERITKTFQEVVKEKNPKAFLVGTDERDAKVLSMGVKKTEQGSEKKHDTELLSQENQRKEACESRNQSVNQDIEKSKKAKEAESADQCTYNTERTEAAAAIEDQMAKPRFPTTQQFEVEECTLQEDCKKKHEQSPKSQKEYHTNDLRNSIGTKEQESERMEVLKPEAPLEELLKKSEQETRKDEFQKGEKIEEKMQDIEQSKSKVDDKDQQDVSKEIGAAEIIGRTEAKEQYASNAGSPAGSKETEKDLEATHETEKNFAQNVEDNKLRNREEIKKTISEENDEVKYAAELRRRTQVKEHQRKSETAENEEEPPKLKEQIIEWKSPKTKECVPESTGIKQHGYGTEDTTLSQQSTHEENRTPENAVDELPETNTDTDYRKLVESGDPSEDERVESFPAHIPENQGFGDNQEGTKCPKISTGDPDKKGYQITKDIDEELLRKQDLSGKIVHEERGVQHFAKRGEPEEDPKQLHKRDKVKPIQTAIDKKPIIIDITPEIEKVNGFKQVAETMQKPQVKIEMISKKGMDKPQRDETPPLAKEIKRKQPPELLWSSMGPENSQVKEDTTDEGHEECDIIEVEKQRESEEKDVSGGNNDKTKRTKKLFVPLFIAGSALLVSLVFMFVHRRRTKRR
ncbi:uncharacterized protein [Arachis hypogaea]|uniref:uncharacterized protein n=1 Tax=Arachis hypogaea TaxID=3818 RepID=UPI003B21386B